jgi:hypothetical protein
MCNLPYMPIASPTPRRRPTLTGPYHVFIGHAGPVKPQAEQLRHMLHRDLGLTVFLDKYMRPGVAADAAILGAAHGAHVGLTLFSEEFADRKWPLRELSIFARRRNLLPALVPPLTYEEWEDCLGEVELSKGVRAAALRTVMVTGSDQELLAWQHKVCLAVVRALVAKVRGGLPDRAWAGELRVRVKDAVRRMCESRSFTHLTLGDILELQEEWGALVC